MLYSLSAALTTHPSYLHFRRGENTDNPPSLTREGLDARAPAALSVKRNHFLKTKEDPNRILPKLL